MLHTPSPQYDALIRQFFQEAFIDTWDEIDHAIVAPALNPNYLSRLEMPYYIQSMCKQLNVYGYNVQRLLSSGAIWYSESAALTPLIDEVFRQVAHPLKSDGTRMFPDESFLACRPVDDMQSVTNSIIFRHKLNVLHTLISE